MLHVVYPGREFPPKDHTTPESALIVSTGEAANPVNSYVLTYREIRQLMPEVKVQSTSRINKKHEQEARVPQAHTRSKRRIVTASQ